MLAIDGGIASAVALDGTIARARELPPTITTEPRGPGALDEALPETRDTELVVIGTHHSHALGEWMLGSVGHDLAMHLPCPVAIVPERPGE